MSQQLDAVVIGAGPGGYVAAIRLAQLGQKVAIIEKEALGGVCLNWGCIPSKAMIYASSLYEKMTTKGETMGLFVENPRVDLAKMVEWKAGVVNQLTGGIGQLLKKNGVEIIRGLAEFTDKNTLTVTAEGEAPKTVKAKNFMIATGSRPIEIPGFEYNGKNIISSTEALELEEVPKSMAVIGGGVIGLEIGCLYAKLGTEVTVIEMADQLLPGTDKEIVKVLERSFKKRKLKFYTNAQAQAAKDNGTSVTLSFKTKKGEEIIDVDKVLVAVGRKPNSHQVGLDKAGVKVDDRGFIPTDNQMKTNVPHIYAIGDVTKPPLLAHKASKEGLVAAAVIAGENEIYDVKAMPAAIFTDPEIATVGLSEHEALKIGYNIKVGTFPFQASGRALSMGQTDGLVKMITDADTDEVLGVHMIGPDVSELIGEPTLGIELGATAEDIALTVHTHPTLPEAIMEAAEAVHGKAVHIFQKEKPETKKSESQSPEPAMAGR